MKPTLRQIQLPGRVRLEFAEQGLEEPERFALDLSRFVASVAAGAATA